MAKKITYQQAIQLLDLGIFPKCKISSRELVPVKSLNDLENLKRLADNKVQGFELWDYSKDVKKSIPKDAMELTIDEAFELISGSETVYGFNGSTDIEFKTCVNLINFCRSCSIQGATPFLYWYV